MHGSLFKLSSDRFMSQWEPVYQFGRIQFFIISYKCIGIRLRMRIRFGMTTSNCPQRTASTQYNSMCVIYLPRVRWCVKLPAEHSLQKLNQTEQVRSIILVYNKASHAYYFVRRIHGILISSSYSKRRDLFVYDYDCICYPALSTTFSI